MARASKKTKPASSAVRKRRDKPLTSKVKAGAPRRVAPKDVDPAFLTDAELARREAFAQAYCACGKLSEAALTAGFTGTSQSLRTTGFRLFNEPAVKARIEAIRSDLYKELGITHRGILAEYARIAFFDLGKCFDEHGNLLPMNEIPEDTRRALAGHETKQTLMGSGDDAMEIIEKKVKATSKTDALAKLGNHLGMFKTGDDKPQLTAEEFIRAMIEARQRIELDRNGRKPTLEHQP